MATWLSPGWTVSREIGQAIRAARMAKGMSLRALSEALDVSAPFLSDVELGRRGVDRHVDKICRVLGVPRELLAPTKLLRDEIAWIEARPSVIARILRGMRSEGGDR